MNENTWIKLYRKFTKWEWFNVSEMVHLFIYLLLSANNEPDEWHGIKIERGQLITGLNSLHKATNISFQTLRTCLKRLEKTKEINIQTTNKYSIITICKYEEYQPKQQTTNKQSNKQLTNNQQTTNNKQEYKEEKNKEEELKARALIFKDNIRANKKDYPTEMLNEFFEYWIEPNKSKTKMRFEGEKFFDIPRRLTTWSNREKNFPKKEVNKIQSITIQDSATYK